MTSRALQEFGYGVIEASGGHQALGVLERKDTRIDLLITDVILPGMDGQALAIQLTRLLQQKGTSGQRTPAGVR
jgi:CheY-like chemotaxis protein